jgi:hypothetical protein
MVNRTSPLVRAVIAQPLLTVGLCTTRAVILAVKHPINTSFPSIATLYCWRILVGKESEIYCSPNKQTNEQTRGVKLKSV